MPLPDGSIDWPPAAHADIHADVREWAAWYTGDRQQLYAAYSREQGTHLHNGQPHRGGIVGAASRMFWGTPVADGQPASKLHIPAAADIAETSAGLLFAEPPTLTVDDAVTQARLDELFDPAMWAEIVEAGEQCAGLSGVFLRVGFDSTISDRPLMSVIGPDAAYPVFRWGRLVEVLFAWNLDISNSGEVLRHLELHGVEQGAGTGPGAGYVEHGLYQGRSTTLGRRLPLEAHPATAGFEVDSLSRIATDLEVLDVRYVINRSNRRRRNEALGQNLGQPDIAGIEPLLDALDEAWTSWMRDIRLGKARIVVPQGLLSAAGPGGGGIFNIDTEVFVGINALTGVGDMPIEMIQPAIRHAEHAATTAALLERCVDGAGYSAQTFGLNGDVAMTATESLAKTQKTNRTRGKKIRYWTPELSGLAEILLAVDAAHYGGKGTPQPPRLEWPPAARDDLPTLARTVALVGDAMSAETKVRTLHPNWTPEQVLTEVNLILDEMSTLTPADPFAQPSSVDPGTPTG